MRKTILWMALAVMSLTASAQQLWYDHAASHWLEALPIGNSHLGAMIYGGADTDARAQLSSFPDQGKVSGWAKEAMQWAVATKLIEGVNSGGKDYLQPRTGATRAQVATIIMRFSQWLEKTNSVK